MMLALLLGIGRRRRAPSRKRSRASTRARSMPKRVANERLDLCALARAQQAVVDEDAGQRSPIARCTQRRRHRRVDAAGEPADDAAFADLRRGCARPPRSTNALHASSAGSAAADAEQEVREQHLAAALGVHDLGVELHAADGRLARSRTAANGRVLAAARAPSKPGGQRCTRSPWLIQTVRSRRSRSRAKSRGRRVDASTRRAPYSRCVGARSTLAAERWRRGAACRSRCRARARRARGCRGRELRRVRRRRRSPGRPRG